MEKENKLTTVRKVWKDVVIKEAEGHLSNFMKTINVAGYSARWNAKLGAMDIYSRDESTLISHIAIISMPDPENYLFQPIRAAVIDKKKLLDRGFIHAYKTGYPALCTNAENSHINALQVIGYFAAKKMEDNNVHVAFSLCVPDDYKWFTKEKAMVFLYNRFLSEPQCVNTSGKLIFNQESYSKMNASDIEGDDYIYHLPTNLSAQYKYFERRLINYFKLEN